MLIFVDGCDNYDGSENSIRDVYDFNFWSIITAEGRVSTGRFGGGCMYARQITPGYPFWGKIIPMRGTTPGVDDLFVGVSVFIPTPGAGNPIVAFSNTTFNDTTSFRDSSDYNDGLNTIWLVLNSSGFLAVYNESTLIATSTSPFTYGSWNRIEMRASADNAGTIEVRRNGVVEITFTGDTYVAGEKGFDWVYGFSHNASILYDDIVIYDQTGAAFNTWLGDLRIDTLRPNATVSQASTVTGAASPHLALDEVRPNGLTDYVSLATAGNRDVLEFSNLSDLPDTVFGVVMTASAKTSGTTGRQYKQLITDGVNTSFGADRDLPLSVFNYNQDAFATAPDGAAWNATSVNALTAGYEVVL